MKKESNEATLGQRIKAARKKKGLTQEKLAEEMCICKQSISAYENDQVDLGLSVIMELSRMLDTTPAYLIGIETEQDQCINEIVSLMSNIKDVKVRELLLAQIRAAAIMYSGEEG